MRNTFKYDVNICTNIQHVLIPLRALYVGSCAFMDTRVCIVQVRIVPRSHNVHVLFVNIITSQTVIRCLHDCEISR